MQPRFAGMLLIALVASVAAQPMQCTIGPIVESLGGTQWQVSSCDDGRSLVFATMAGNPAMPFVFFVQRSEDPPRISGEGKGSKEHSAAAFDALQKMTATQFDKLVQATKDANAAE